METKIRDLAGIPTKYPDYGKMNWCHKCELGWPKTELRCPTCGYKIRTRRARRTNPNQKPRDDSTQILHLWRKSK